MAGESAALRGLRAMRVLLSEPSRWMKGWFAETAKGQHTRGFDPFAVRFCIYGASEALRDHELGTVIERRLCETLGVSEAGELSRFNDAPTTTHADILALLDRAIAAEEAK